MNANDINTNRHYAVGNSLGQHGVLLLALTLAGTDLSAQTFTKLTTGPASVANCSAGAWGDFNNDGWQDLYAVPLATDVSYLFLNNGNGTFTRLTNTLTQSAGAQVACGWGDFDNDGRLDLFRLLLSGSAHFFQNQGGSVFTNVTTATLGNLTVIGADLAWGDYDSDGNLDIFLASTATTPQGLLLHNEGNSTFRASTGLTLSPSDTVGAAWGDYDNDGRPDLAITRYRISGIAGSNRLFHNEGDGTFRAMTNSPIFSVPDGNAVCWGDYDNDGYLDLFLGRRLAVPNLYHNNGNGTFTRVTSGPMATTSSTGIGASWVDCDNDGYLDLFISGYYSSSFLYHNNGNGTFTRITTGNIVTDSATAWSLAWGDYDNDGFPDLFVANESGNNSFYRNNGNTNNWITIQCEGRISNRSAFGTKVRVKATVGGQEIWQLREISRGTGVGGQNDLRAQFGLGDATNVTTLRIEWPSGIVHELSDLPAKQFLTVREPSKLSGTSTNGDMWLRLQGGKEIAYRIETSADLATWSPWMVLTNRSSSTNLTVPITVPAQFIRVLEE